MNSGMDSAYGHASVASSLVSAAFAFPAAWAYTRTWSRPASLARYSATSAAASNSNRSLPCWPSTATPIETVTLMRASAAATLRLAASALSRSAIPYAPAPSVRGNSAVNSSLQKDMSVVAERVVAPHGWLRYDFERIRSVRHLTDPERRPGPRVPTQVSVDSMRGVICRLSKALSCTNNEVHEARG